MELKDLSIYCESKIEEALLDAIASRFADPKEANMVLSGMPPANYTITLPLNATSAAAHLMPQAVISGIDLSGDWRYRVDFLLILGVRRGFRKCYAIECDGHDWHEKTKQQVARDKLRDRRMILNGIVPIRFSGSEIHRNAKRCAEYVHELAYGSLGDVLWQEYNAGKASSAGKKAKKRGRKP